VKFYASIDGVGRICPAHSGDHDQLSKLPRNEVLTFDVRRSRNIRFHRKYFALLNLGFDNQDQYSNFDHFRKVVQMKAGHFDEVATDKGLVFLPRSISFSDMDETAFSELYDGVLDVVADMLGTAPDDIRAAVAEFG